VNTISVAFSEVSIIFYLVDGTYDLAGIAGRKNIVRNIFGDNAQNRKQKSGARR
jgi:hypothetical protein